MRIVKPHGRTETAPNAEGRPKRRIHRHPGDGDVRDIEAFAAEHPELVLAQWVSAIDKIAAKPRGSAKPTREQRDLRDKLGEAAWDALKRRLPLDRLDELETLWRRKIHPYGEDVDKERSGRAKGRWYGRFAGKDGPGAVDAAGVARKIEEHLHDKEYRIGGGRPDRREGRIAARAASIAGNVVTPVDRLPRAAWTDDDRERYRKAGDVAAEIRREAEALEAGERRVGPRVAAEALHAHYAKLFPGEDGKALSIAEAGNRAPGPFALHMAVRGAYSRILKNHGKDRKEHGDRRRPVSGLLPADMDALFRLVEAMGRNRDLNALVRLGKLIHYEAAPVPNMETAAGDEPEHAIDRWPDETKIERGRYRTSAGQSDIKRNEAFVRVWRGAVALAQRTLTDWADPDGKIDRDIFLGRSIKEAVGKSFDEDAHTAKLRVLFGGRARLFDEKADGRNVLGFALTGWARLRNGSFHFKGRGGFARALKLGAEDKDVDERVLEAARELLETDRNERHGRLVEALRAAHVEFCYGRKQLGALFDALVRGAPARPPLPRFRRVLDRAKKAWRLDKRYRLRLPDPENRPTLEANPGRLCRSIVLKTLYERAFPAWLEARDAAAFNGWIARAVERATEAAREINKDPDAAARAAGLVRLKDGEGIAAFADRLTALTATEYRVQRGYASDADNARKQAGHIEKLRCDVVAQAFEAYLEAEGLDWTLEDPADGPLPEEKKADLGAIAAPPANGDEPEDWRAALYVLLHTVPVETAGRLRHQLRKWAVLEGKARTEAPSAEARAVEDLLDLYLDMHDAKFEGGGGVAGAEALAGLFENRAVFRRACPVEPGAAANRHVPWRGLREMLRFGAGEPRLKPVFESRPIAATKVDELERLETVQDDGGVSPIAAAQARREDLHATWAKKKRLSPDDLTAYRAALDTVIRHRHLAAHVRLVNHAKLHRLAMDVLGRLADYAGLWERDLYFATLALVRLEGKTPESVFSEKDLGDLKNGQIIQALRIDAKKSGEGESAAKHAIKEELRKLFGQDFLGDTGAAGVRNRLAHFRMLRGRENKPFDLTGAVNDARRLMAYDRKLKNAVSRSIVELLAREGLDLAWDMRDHELTRATVASRRAVHLGGVKIDKEKIVEDLHGEPFVAMAAALFGGEARGAARKGGPPDRGRPAPGSPPPRPAVLPVAGQRVRAVLIDEKTKRGGWKAETVGTTRVVGHILNSDEVPPDAGPGLEEELVVKVSNPANASFEWPSPAVEARLAKPAARREGRPKGRRR